MLMFTNVADPGVSCRTLLPLEPMYESTNELPDTADRNSCAEMPCVAVALSSTQPALAEITPVYFGNGCENLSAAVKTLIVYLDMNHSPAKEHDALWSVIVRQKQVGVQLLLGKAEGFRGHRDAAG